MSPTLRTGLTIIAAVLLCGLAVRLVVVPTAYMLWIWLVVMGGATCIAVVAMQRRR